MKKISLLCFILATTTAQFASADVVVAEGPVAVAPAGVAPSCPKAFQGAHLSGNIGYGIGRAKRKFSDSLTSASLNNSQNFNGIDGGIGVGYTHRLCNWALGIAFDANWTNVKGHSNAAFGPNNVAIKARLRNSLQLYGRLGYVMREIAMPFIGLGWDNSQWKQSTNTNILARTTRGAFLFTDSTSKSKRLNSLLWKLGVDFLATRHVVLGFEYTGTIGKAIQNSKAHDSLPGAYSTSIKPQYNKFALTAKIVY